MRFFYIAAISLIVPTFASSQSPVGTLSSPRSPPLHLTVNGSGPAAAAMVSPTHINQARLDALTLTPDEIAWLNDKDKVITDYNHAIESEENLQHVGNLFKLSVYSVLCREAHDRVGVDLRSPCPTLSDQSVQDAVYESLQKSLPDSLKQPTLSSA
jgi:hypothetical protein